MEIKFVNSLEENSEYFLNESPSITDSINDIFALHVDNEEDRNDIYYKAYSYINWILSTKSMNLLIDEFKKSKKVTDNITGDEITFKTLYEYLIYCLICNEIGLDFKANIKQNLEKIEKLTKASIIKKEMEEENMLTLVEFKNIEISDKYKKKSEIF